MMTFKQKTLAILASIGCGLFAHRMFGNDIVTLLTFGTVLVLIMWLDETNRDKNRT